ncbi:MAG TPA: ABC transporter permease [Thermoplasmata archaeon]|nr:ABC transporter permease [Thermoplasmata archaeon]
MSSDARRGASGLDGAVVRYAWDGIRRRRGRSALTALGIGLATALVIVLLALSAGIDSSASELAQSSGVYLLATSANTSLTQSNFPPVASAHALAAEIPRVDPNVATASPWLVADLVFANSSLYARTNDSPDGSGVPAGWAPTGSGIVGWIPGDNSGITVPPIFNGTGFTAPGDPHFANGTFTGPSTHEIVLDQALAGVLRVSVGGELWASAATPSRPAELAGWFANATIFRVVGISGPFWLIPSALLAFGYLSEVQSVLGPGSGVADPASLVLIHLHAPGSATDDQSDLGGAFPGLTFFTLSDILKAVQNVVDVYRTFGTLVGGIGVVVALLFTSTVLVMSVDDRSREIALLRAIGFRPTWIAQEIASEGLLLAALGLAVGAPLGLAGAEAINLFLGRLVAGLPAAFSFVTFDPTVVASSVLLVVAIGLAASVLPIARALRLPIAEELRAP